MTRPRASSVAASRGDDWIVREIAALRQEIRQQAAARSAEQTAIGAGGIQSVDFDGTGPDDPGTQGWMIGRLAGQESYLVMNGRLVVTGITSIAGLLAIVGALTVSGTTAITGPLDVTGATTLGGATTITGDTTVTGDLDVSGALDVGGTATITGNLQSSNYVAGTSGYRLTPTTIEMNDLAIKAQAVPDAALASLVKGESRTATASPTLTTTPTTVASTTFTVPAGMTSVTVMAASSLSLGSTALYANVQTVIGGNAGTRMDVPITTAALGAGSSNHARTFAVSGGGTFTVATVVDVASGTAPGFVATSASAIFYR